VTPFTLVRALAIGALFAMVAGCATPTVQRLTGSVPTPATTVVPNLPMRGVWIPTPDHTRFWDSPATMDAHFAELASAGFNTAFLVVWNQGRTLYPSPVMERLTGVKIDERMVARDPLQEASVAARKNGIALYAWFEFGFATDLNGGKGKEIADKYPEWVSLNQDGRPVVKNGFRWLNALDPEVQDFMLSLVLEVVEKYDIVGIQGDDRLPAMPSEGGYNARTMEAFAAAHQGMRPGNPKNLAWVQWRSDRLGDFLARLYREVKMRKPTMVVSLSPSVWPWARDEYLQDWPAWVRRGIVDTVSPQLYRKDIEAYERVLRAMAEEQAPQFRERVFPGLLLNLGREFRASPEYLRAMVAANRRHGIMGEVYFFNEGVRGRLEEFRSMYRSEDRGQMTEDKRR
jgi:uncharacterized lipoprotein YddW (UPF0748 family)